MQPGLALQRYLQRHIEQDLPAAPLRQQPWRHVVVIPAYGESAEFIQRLSNWQAVADDVLFILVLNRPDADPAADANDAVREAVAALGTPGADGGSSPLIRLNAQAHLYMLDLDKLVGPLPSAQGVGLARKFGCDLALHWISQGAIASQWIGSTDADATLPPDYFTQRVELAGGEVAAIYPFWHTPGPDPACNAATALYELRLHHYVLGLEFAGSPFAHHSLGSCLAVKADAYAQVRGFPKRSGGEDFYLLNKLAKLGPIASLKGECIQLQSRYSRRAPFGTGPAVAKISADPQPEQLPLFYHPACFEALRALLAAIPSLREATDPGLPGRLDNHPEIQRLHPALAQACSETIVGMGLEQALAHCRRQGKSQGQFLRQFHQWFDGFRTLKFIHGVRDCGSPQQSLTALRHLRPQLWPLGDQWQVKELRRAAAQHRGWLPP
jgi:hypothetical protein